MSEPTIEIVIRTDVSPAKVDLHELAIALEKVIDENFRSHCHAVYFREVPTEIPHVKRN